MIDIEYLKKKFCATPDDPRSYLHNPFNLDGHTYCTNGAVFVRVLRDSRFDGCEKNKVITAIQKLYSGLVVDESRFAPVPTLPSIHEICPNCIGMGCEGCDNLGYFLDLRRIKCGAAEISNEYAHKLAVLPSSQIMLPTENDKPIYFRFTDGDGFLMPMGPLKEGE